MKYAALLFLLAGGCILPVSTGAPLPATTVGKGRIGGAISGEAPTLDLIADNADNDSSTTSGAVAYGAAPAAAVTLTLSYGITDDTDLELSGEGALYYFLLPMPTGGSLGLRQHIDAGDFDLGLAAKFGRVGSSAEVSDSSGSSSESSASATFAALQAVVQTKRGFVRPLVAVNLMPARVHRAPSDEPAFTFKGVASSVTGGLMLVGEHALIGPYLTATNFYSDRFDNSGWFVSGGIVFAVRPDRNRAPRIPDPAPPVYAPPPPMSAPPAPAPTVSPM